MLQTMKLLLVTAVALLLAECRGQMSGGRSDMDVKDSVITNFAKSAEEKLSLKENSQMELIRIVKAQSQVVAGMKYYLTLEFRSAGCGTCDLKVCDVDVWVRPWLEKQEMSDPACTTVPMTTQKQQLIGGEESVLVGDDGVMKAADFAIDEMNGRSNNMYDHVLLRVDHATSQVVAGIKYHLTLSTGLSECQKGAKLESLDLCAPTHISHTCKVTVWRTPEGAHKLLDSTCNKLSVASDEVTYQLFKEFQLRYNKTYQTFEESEKRYNIFLDNMLIVRQLQETEQGTATYGATMFADLTAAEFKSYVGKRWDLSANDDMMKSAIPDITPPTAYDWRDHGAVTPVKNQGSCGSCWAFSTTGNIEGQWAIKKTKLVSLSEQELVDCDKLDEGCNGGLPSNAYKEIIRLGGMETETEYKYVGEDEKCEFIKKDVRVYINNSVSISSDEAEMAQWLSQNGPISIGINAFAMQFYFGGISHPWKIFCNPSSLDHGVLIVGYGVQGTKPYWIVKNSWGPSWGEQGYYLVYRGDGVCGLNTMCTSAVIN